MTYINFISNLTRKENKMEDEQKGIDFSKININLNSIQSMQATTISALHTIGLLKTILETQSRIISKLESIDQGKVFEELSTLAERHVQLTFAEWVDKKWISVSEK